MQSQWTPGYIKFFYFFILIGMGYLTNDVVSEAFTPARPPVHRNILTATPTLKDPFPDFDVYIPPEWRKPTGRLPSGDQNPFAACAGVETKPGKITEATRFAFLVKIRDQLAANSADQLKLLEAMQDCAGKTGSCPGSAKRETTKIKQQVEQNISRLRIYMALMDNRADAYRARIWSEKDENGKFLFTLKDAKAATGPDAPFRNIVLKHLVGSFAENGDLQGLSPKEVEAVVDIYNRDIAALMKNFRHVPNGRQDENAARIAFFKKQNDEIMKFYQSKYSVLIGRAPILAYYRVNAYDDRELAAALASIQSNAEEFQKNNLPSNPRFASEMNHLIMSGPVVEAHLHDQPEDCAIAQDIHQGVRKSEGYKKFFVKWRGWLVFGGVTLCAVVSAGTAAVPCGIGGAAVSSAFLASDYIVLDDDAAELVTNTKNADPKKILEVWARAKKFKVSVVLHVISLATLVGVIPIATTDPLRGAVQEILKNSTEPIAAKILIERLAVQFQGVIEAKVIENLVTSWTNVEKDIAADKNDIMYYHQFIKKLRKT